MPLAEIYPLVTARALARPFTYDVPDEAAQGDVSGDRARRARVRGVVVATDVARSRRASTIADAGQVVDQRAGPLVELALWLADYYGSTPARALALVAPHARARRGTAAEPSRRDALRGEPEPDELTAAQRDAVDADRRRARRHGRSRPSPRADREREDRGLPAGGRGGARARPRRHRARPGDRAHAADRRSVPGAIRRRRGGSPLGLTDAERRDERERIASGEARVVVGARSAIFAPVGALGLVVVDEEHDASFKQESDPRYDARTVAAKRAAIEGAVAVYGSATPRAESWARLERLELPSRIGAPMPTVKLVDLRREAGYPLSAPLLAELSAVAERGGRAILLLNRRGISGAIHCRSCGTTRRCRSCDIALTLHADSRLHCHHCGYSTEMPDSCPECGSVELARIGAGTQRLDAELARRVPGLERIRLDADTAARPAALREALERFSSARSAALIGTQMVAKGHHFPGVEVAAVVDADAGLAFPDFRSEERTFQLVTQLAGRSGRDAPGGSSCRRSSPTRRRSRTRCDTTSPDTSHTSSRDGASSRTHLFHILLHSSSPDLTRATCCALCVSSGARSRRRRCSCSGRRRSCVCEAAIALSSWRRRTRRGPSQAVLRPCSRVRRPAMRRDGLSAVVDVDPQSP